MESTKKSLLMAMLVVGLMGACKKDEPAPVEDNENLTTLKLKFTESGTTSTFMFRDTDGDGGNAPTIDKIALKPNKTYTLAVEVLDETKTPVADITADIEAEKDEHLFEYVTNPSSLLTITPTDKDSRGYNVGLKGSAITTATGTGKLRVVLHHQPPVGGVAVKNGSFTVGSTDIDVSFDVEVK
ncbi:hypothetical protein LV89_03125 [Arcicella aurantiaca]|uniref:Type 1 periplasmic binding fold superfamily protein n=1 Tax=Arcicella aurantiaca TaxID=591202 RepID=A0A316E0U5_9BACT|nr:hypothetical protein [Arcicella aurantiaca]PWK23308.1 hypothetical protein LV89_03125 [Arcicella aurantiaca]